MQFWETSYRMCLDHSHPKLNFTVMCLSRGLVCWTSGALIGGRNKHINNYMWQDMLVIAPYCFSHYHNILKVCMYTQFSYITVLTKWGWRTSGDIWCLSQSATTATPQLLQPLQEWWMQTPKVLQWWSSMWHNPVPWMLLTGLVNIKQSFCN